MDEYFSVLGRKATDLVTGFSGIVTSVSFDVTGCCQVAITPPIDKDGKTVAGKWFDYHGCKYRGKPVFICKWYPAQRLKGASEHTGASPKDPK